MIKATIRRPIAALDFSRHGLDEGTATTIEAGEYELERIPNPIRQGHGDWLAMGTIGMSETGWRQLTAGIDAAVEDHPGDPEVVMEEDGVLLEPLLSTRKPRKGALMKSILLLFACATLVRAQFCVGLGCSSGGGGGGGASATYQLTDLSVTRTPTVETIGASCSSSTQCNTQFGAWTNSCAVTLVSGSGTAYWYIDSALSLKVAVPTAGAGVISVTVTGSGCSTVTGTAFPAYVQQLYVTTATSGTWDAITPSMDKRSFLQGPGMQLAQGTNMSIAVSGNTATLNATGGYTPRFWPLAQDAPTGGGCQYGTGYVFPSGNDFPHHSATHGSGIDNCTVAMASTGSTIIFSHWWDGTTALTANIVWLEDTATVALAQWGVSVACPASQNSASYSTPVTGTGTPASIGQFVTTSIVPGMGSCSGPGMIYLKLTNSAAGSGTTYTHNIDLVGISI